MDSVRNIFLVGFMASGKTSVGRALSKATGWPFIDADDRVVQRAGKTIDQIFRDSGEPPSGPWSARCFRSSAAGTTRS